MEKNNYNTFWDIISNNRIEIPIIQRDYTYGRKTEAVVRRKFVEDISRAILKNSPMNLDFVYGKLLGKENETNRITNKDNIESLLKSIESYATGLDINIDYSIANNLKTANEALSFVPLDGQQRLTTLFLFHWYLAQVGKKKSELDILKKFSYSTRNSSKEFCHMICSNQFEISDTTNNAAELIKNSDQYFTVWEKDPTVFSMLVVIEDIHQKLKSEILNHEQLWSNLTSKGLVSFDFFDLENFDQTDDLYIKMNARGKHLTHFENFKAWLIKDQSDIITVDNWKKKLDLGWTDLFWKYKNKSSYKIDNEFLQYFKILLLADYLKNIKTDEGGLTDEKELDDYSTEDWSIDDFKSVIATLRKPESNPLELFKVCSEFGNNIDDYLHVLDYLNFDLNQGTDSLAKKYTKCSLTEFIFGERVNKYNWWDTTFHYAITRYLSALDGATIHFKEWVRVISNLIYNTKIDSPKLFIEAILSIDALIKKMSVRKSVYETLVELTADDIEFFSLSQREEEIKKVKWIIQDNLWEDVFIAAENHSYFYGQIGFIFNLDNNENDRDIFRNNFEKTAALFSEEVLSENTYLLTRTFLTQGDCFYHEGDNRMFNSNYRITVRQRSEHWRKFFDKYPDYIKKIINHADFDTNHILESLETIIKKEKVNVKGQYLEKYINNYKLFNYSRKNYIKKFNHGYYPLNSTRTSGYFVELNTYDWYLRNKEKKEQEYNDLKLTYQAVKGEANDPYIEITSEAKIETYKINFDCAANEFNLKKGAGLEKFNSIDEAFKKIVDNGK
mgnify:FL=1